MSSIKLKGSTSGDITISAPAVAGTNTLTLPAETGNVITSTSLNTESNFVRLAGETLSSDVSSISFSTSVITTTYKTYVLYSRLQPKTDAARVILRVNDNTGSELATINDYQAQVYRGGGTDFSDTTLSSIYPVSASGNASGEYAYYKHEFSEVRASDKKTTFLFQGTNVSTTGNCAFVTGGGICNVAEDNQGMRLLFTVGDIASGSSYVLFGVKS